MADTTRKNLTYGLAQIPVRMGQVSHNVTTILRAIDLARSAGCHVVALPEMCVGGYLLADHYYDQDLLTHLMAQNNVIREAARGITVVWGNVYHDTPERHGSRGLRWTHPGKDGRPRLFNAVFVARNGQWAPRKVEPELPGGVQPLPAGVQPKLLLPNYSIFDDERYFTSLSDHANDLDCDWKDWVQPFNMAPDDAGAPHWVGVSCCEDAWAQTYREQAQPKNLLRIVAQREVEAIINISASPSHSGKPEQRDAVFRFQAEDQAGHRTPTLYVNRVGLDNNGKNLILYDGNSAVYDADGNLLRCADNAFKPQTLIIQRLEGAPVQRPARRPIEDIYETLIAGIQHFPETMGTSDANFLVGLSGGIDSSLVTALVERALGAEHVCALNLPSRYNSDTTRNAAAHLTEALGVRYTVIPIEDTAEDLRRALAAGKSILGIPPQDFAEAYGRARDALPEKTDALLAGLTDENLQAKLRSRVLVSSLAQELGMLWTNNGNRVEVHLGYATLDGDWGGGLAPIASLTKEEVMSLAQYMNEEVYRREVIPKGLYDGTIAPSAELRNNQQDPIHVGYHCRILKKLLSPGRPSEAEFLDWYAKGTLHTQLGITHDVLTRYGMERPPRFVDDLQWFCRGRTAAVFKRVQSVPMIRTQDGDYGWDVRETMGPIEPTPRLLKLRTSVRALPQYPGV